SHWTRSTWEIRKASSRGRADPVLIRWVSVARRGQGVTAPLTRSTAKTVSIAASTATPQLSPSPWRQRPSPREKSSPSTLPPAAPALPLAAVAVADREQRPLDVHAQVAGGLGPHLGGVHVAAVGVGDQ